MEPINHQFRKENDLPNLQGIMFYVSLQGCITKEVTTLTETHPKDLGLAPSAALLLIEEDQ